MNFDFPVEVGGLKVLAMVCRIGAFVFAFPFFEVQQIPGRYKMLFVVCLSVALYPTLSTEWGVGGTLEGIGITRLALLVMSEMALGLAVAVFVQATLDIFMYAGSVMDMDIGFSASSEFDPSSGENRTILSSLLVQVFLVSFLVADGHHEIIKIAAYSFESIGPGAFALNGGMLETAISATSNVFVVGLQIALPTMATMFMINIGMGILARIGEDFPVMILSFAIHLGVGLVVVGAILPTILEICRIWGRHLNSTLESLLLKG